jgi:hypothetical protein
VVVVVDAGAAATVVVVAAAPSPDVERDPDPVSPRPEGSAGARPVVGGGCEPRVTSPVPAPGADTEVPATFGAGAPFPADADERALGASRESASATRAGDSASDDRSLTPAPARLMARTEKVTASAVPTSHAAAGHTHAGRRPPAVGSPRSLSKGTSSMG